MMLWKKKNSSVEVEERSETKKERRKRMRCNKLRYDGALSWIARRGQYYELNWAERGGGERETGFAVVGYRTSGIRSGSRTL